MVSMHNNIQFGNSVENNWTCSDSVTSKMYVCVYLKGTEDEEDEEFFSLFETQVPESNCDGHKQHFEPSESTWKNHGPHVFMFASCACSQLHCLHCALDGAISTGNTLQLFFHSRQQ